MVTMREAVAGYRKIYFGDSNMQDMRDANIRVGSAKSKVPAETRLDAHDTYHVIASGIADIVASGKSVDEAFTATNRSGLVSRNVGIKAEILSHIYSAAISQNVGSCKSLDEFNYKTADGVLSEDRLKTLVSISQSEIKAKEAAGKPLSDVPELATLMESNRNLQDHNSVIGQIITPEEIEFHIQKAIALNKKLRKEHPECVTISDDQLFSEVGLNNFMRGVSKSDKDFFRPKHFDREKLLDLPLEAFQIDNFRTTEKAMLGDALKGKGGGVSLP